MNKINFVLSMGGYNFTSHKGTHCASWVGRVSATEWMALDPWGQQRQGFPTRLAAATWCKAQKEVAK